MEAVQYEVNIYTRFCETDQSGKVNSISYLAYFEEARSRFLQELKIDKNSRTLPLGFMLVSVTCNYYRPAEQFQNLKIITEVAEIGRKSFTLRHRLWDEDKKYLIAESIAVNACYSWEEKGTVPIPDEYRVLLKGKPLVSQV